MIRYLSMRSRLMVLLASYLAAPCTEAAKPFGLKENANLVILGNGLGSRMMQFGLLETEIQRRHHKHRLVIRNMADEGNTPGFRPHSGRPSPWAFPGAEKHYASLSEAKDRWGSGHAGKGTYETPDQWLTRLRADLIIAFFGYNASFRGPEGLESFKEALRGFILHTRAQSYNGKAAPGLALVSPIAFEDLSSTYNTPNGQIENANLALYTAAMEDVTGDLDVLFVNAFTASQQWYDHSTEPITLEGFQLNEKGYQLLAPLIADTIFAERKKGTIDGERLRSAMQEKNWIWHKLYKIPNGVHVYGQRHRPFGPDNYPHELKKLNEMATNRDRAIWAVLEGSRFDLEAADARTHALPETKTNYRLSAKNGSIDYLYGQKAVQSMRVPEGFKIEMFASEKEFPNLANPVQMAFDNEGRLWVSTMPSYPHYQPGDAKPDDKLLILEDTNGDGKADRETVFAGGLHLPTGFELASEGVYVAQGTHLVLLTDRDHDQQADTREIVLSGFDDHDTHHVISAFCADPSGAIYMGEGTFLHSNIETPYGPIRSSNGGFFRYAPKRRHLERSARLSIPNPWGTAFDDWGQAFFTDTSDPSVRWMGPGTVEVPYGSFAPNPRNLIEEAHRMRPTSGLEFVSSRHFPEEMQGDLLIHNTIGYLGTKQHTMVDEGTGYQSRHRQDLLKSSDGNFRPVDMEFAPDGSLYITDWHNVLVGHMQHSARDPLRDHVHGRIYRITYPSRPLVKPAHIAGAPIEVLLDNLTLPEYRSRYRTRRELRKRRPSEVMSALERWVAELDDSDPMHAHHLVEAMWVSWGHDRVDQSLVKRLLKDPDYRARAAAVGAIRHNSHRIQGSRDLLMQTANDPHGRVRMEVILAASHMEPTLGLPIVREAGKAPIDDWIRPVYETALKHLQGERIQAASWTPPQTNLRGEARNLFLKGAEVYRREGHCITCHQEKGQGLPAAQFPPLAESEWVVGQPERLIALTLHGLLGPMEVKGKTYQGLVPMTPFKGLKDDEIAAVLTYVRNAFGNQAPMIGPDTVRAVREATRNQNGFIQASTLLESFPEVD
ncbi:MAG: HEAT repeat domain-containing protein [Verrucomicrobiota bacterium]|nr:HEAT repeat domain-containing protein [Verrucomicrobiota bacterium]